MKISLVSLNETDNQINILRVKKILLILFILFLLGCEDKEKDANLIYQEAINQWNQGMHKDAIDNLEKLLIRYNKTEISKKAYEQRLIFQDIYNKQFNPYSVKKDIFSAILQKEINKYFKINTFYPDNLNSLDLNSEFRDYLDLCKYSKAPTEDGFKIDCKDLSQLYQKTFDKKIESVIPINSFIAYYSMSGTPNDGVFAEEVNNISLNYNTDKDFYNIKPELFSGYWIGYIKIDKSQTKKISLEQSHSHTKLLIDDEIIFDGSDNTEQTIELEQGIHKVEVYHQNYWPTAGFNLMFVDDKKISYLNYDELISFFKRINHIEFEPIIVSVYESTSKNNEIDVHLKENSKPIILFLKSYKGVKWNIINDSKNKISAIIYASRYPSTIDGDISNSVILNTEELNINYQYKLKCTCPGMVFNCSGSDFRETKNFIENLTLKELNNFSGKYSTEEFLVPEYKLDNNFINEINANLNLVKIQEQECREKFESTYKNSSNKLFVHRE
jgi:hypothetical protein